MESPFFEHQYEIKQLKQDKQKLRAVLQGIVNSCVHPEAAVRAVMVDLKSIRKVLEETK